MARVRDIAAAAIAAVALSAAAAPGPVPAKPLGPLLGPLTADDYPAAARRYDQQGRTSVRLTVDTSGRVGECAVVQSSGSAALDATTCRLLAGRARFAPARDARGRAVAGGYATSINWVLPPAAAVPPSDAAGPTPPRPRAPIPRHVSPNDYPQAALQARQSGRVAVRLGIGAEGRVTDCTVTASSRSAALDSATCRLLRSRVRFEPARDAAGRPVAGTYTTFVDWTLPARPAPVA